MKRLVLLILAGGSILALFTIYGCTKRGDNQMGLQVVGSVQNILSGNGGNGVDIVGKFKYGLGAVDAAADMGMMGEGLVFDGQIWVRPTFDGDVLTSVRLTDVAYSSFLVGFDSYQVIGLASTDQPIEFGRFLDSLIGAQTTPHRLFGFSGIIEFIRLESSVLRRAAIYNEPITDAQFRADYFQVEKDESPHRAQVFGMCLNPQVGAASKLESRIFYINPAATKSANQLETHAHALVEYNKGKVKVVHVLPQSIIGTANVTIIAAK